MSKLDDVLEGTHEEPEVEEEHTAVGDPAVPEQEPEWPATYETAAEVEAALAADEITEEQAIALLDEIELADGAGPEGPDEDDDTTGPVNLSDDPGDRTAGVGDTVIVLKTGERARVQHATGNGAVALSGEEKPRRTLARDEYRVV